MTKILSPLLFLALILGQATGADRPNVIVIMADDIGLGDLGFHHRERTGDAPQAATPTIDALAEGGLWLTDAHSPTALCSPSRYSVMTGNYTYRSYTPWGVWQSFRRSPVTENDATLGSVARAAGYTTGFIGKWHMGGDFAMLEGEGIYRGEDRGDTPLNVDATRWIAGGPQDRGFDYDFTVSCGVQGPFYVPYENGEWYPLGPDSELINLNENTAKDPFFVSDKGPGTGDSNWDARSLNILMATKAADFIHASAGDDPFLLTYWTSAVHIPHAPPEQLDGEPMKNTTPTPHMDMIRVLDWEVATIVKALRDTGTYENTLIVFTSDNGGLSAGTGDHYSSGGYRGTKNQPYEGGHRVPFIAAWPGVIEPGSRSDALVNGTDLVATIAAIAGTDLRPDQARDSWNLLPLFKGCADFEARTELMQQSGSQNEVMLRQGPWKLIVQSNHALTKWEPFALFNLDENPAEDDSGNLIDHPDHRARAAAMMARYLEIRLHSERTAPQS